MQFNFPADKVQSRLDYRSTCFCTKEDVNKTEHIIKD
jgi:hypothetical protein